MRLPRDTNKLIIAIGCFLLAAICLSNIGCSHSPPTSHTPLPTVLKVGETYDGQHGLCKYGWKPENKGLIVWGRPQEPCSSTYGVSTLQVTLLEVREKIRVTTPDGALIVGGRDEGASAENPDAGFVLVVVPE